MAESNLHSLVLIFAVSALTPMLADASRRVRVPAVVLEIAFGILIGPSVLGWARVDEPISVIAEFGLAFLIFLAGYEIDVDRLRGTPLKLATASWFTSLALGLGVGTVLFAGSFALSKLVVGLALTTTALGTLLPILGDSGLSKQPFGNHVLANGALGEFGPIVAVALVLGGTGPLRSVVALFLFAALGATAIALSRRPTPARVERLMRASLHSSGQATIRFCIVITALLVWWAAKLQLDILLGAFTAGVVARYLIHSVHEEDEVETSDAKLEAVGFGFLIPFFFVVTGIRFDLTALLSDASALARVPIVLVLLLVVRGAPVLLFYRRELGRRSRFSLALMSSAALPLLVVITEIGVRTDRMTPAGAAAMVGAGMVSVFLFPIVALALRPGSDTVPVVAPATTRRTA